MDVLRAVLATTRDAILLSEDGVVRGASEAAAKLLGYDAADELVGFTATNFVSVDDAAVQSAIRERIETGAFIGELSYKRKDGTFQPVEASSVVVERREGGGVTVFTTLRDLRNEHARRESEERFRAMHEGGFEAAFVHREGRVLFANVAADECFGFPRGGLVGTTIDEHIAPESLEWVRQNIQANRTTPYEAYSIRKDGTPFPCEVRGRAVTYRGLDARLVSIRDLTERKQMEASLMLADRLAAIGAMAASVAHDINNPLAYTLLNLEIARRNVGRSTTLAPSEKRQLDDVLALAHEGADRVRTIVGELRAYARRSNEAPASVNLARSLAFACAIVEPELRQRAELKVSVADDVFVQGNETRIGQVFVNLLVNAFQAIPENGTRRHVVSVTATTVPDVSGFGGDHDVVRVEVTDDGAGIAPELIPHVFAPFVSTKSGTVGTGLGLAIAMGIVTSIGGTLDVRSVLGEGTTFTVTLRVAEAPASSPSPSDHADVPTTSRPRARRSILVVDDERSVRSSIAATLSGAHDVVSLGAARSALALVRAGEPFDAVLCDIVMPGMSGDEFFVELEAAAPDLARRTAFVSGGTLDERTRSFVRKRRIPLLLKPFTVRGLEELVDRLLEGDATA
ncbi:MAG: PAS domain S-box protein [Polyangiaceae bacterium]